MSEESKVKINIEQDYPHATVGVLIYNDKGEVLLFRGQEKFGKGWVVPGGHVEMGESCEETVKREAKEETGLDIENIKFLGYQDSIYPPDWRIKRHFIFLDFTAKLKSGEIKLNDELDEYGWFDPKKAMKELILSSGTKWVLKNFLEQQKGDKKSIFSKNKECEKCEEYKQGWARALADYKNLQKETEKKRGEMSEYLKQQILEDFIPVYNNFKTAFVMKRSDGDEAWVKGIEHIKKQFEDVLKNYGVEEIKTVGEKFNENLHDCVAEESGDQEAGVILKEVSGGYTMNGKVVLPAKVVISK